MIEATVVDPTHLELAQPIAALRGQTILVSVADMLGEDSERRDWLDVSTISLQAAYGDSEPDYSPSMVKENNPDYVA
ncbi:MAG: hypothetical protein HZA20_09635 [Nitrospirae bacterium]|nr:hypothetical protein [Nitrospirota bacterium]